MEQPPKALLRHFSSLFRRKAAGEPGATLHPDVVLKHLSRKALIDIIKSKEDKNLPEGMELAEMESKELLELVGNEFLIISHITGQWGKTIPEPQKAPVKTPADTSKDTKETPKKKS
ncbi:hypothetical protein [Croceimicrobium sp.]|uniref:hypothetical protein n=1 Tax=Croceimicrobium sp. TaxID=2828340 RepID=UPI003BAC3A01